MAPEGLPQDMVGKICLNIALIRAELGFHEEAVIMNQKSIEYKFKEPNYNQDDLRDQYILLAGSMQKANQLSEACQSLEQAYYIHKERNGEYNYKTAQILTQLGQAYLKDEAFTKCI